MTDTTAAELQQLFTAQQQAFAADSDPSHALRMDRLARLQALMDEHEAALIAAIDADFGAARSMKRAWPNCSFCAPESAMRSRT